MQNHTIARGNVRKPIFGYETDRLHFPELLAELRERFGARVHAYGLMDNRFHLLLEAPEANQSRTMQRLGVSHSVWFNRRHRRVEHLFQDRFSAVVVEEDSGRQKVAFPLRAVRGYDNIAAQMSCSNPGRYWWSHCLPRDCRGRSRSRW